MAKKLSEKIFKREVTSFCKQYINQNVAFHRYRSWDHCYNSFNINTNTNIDIDNLALHLSMYLASWGMYRGSTFLLEFDYKANNGVVDIILKPKYFNDLRNIKISNLGKCGELILNLHEEICTYYSKNLKEIVKTDGRGIKKINPSDTLITKILLGTLGCTLAYDRYACKTLANFGINKTLH